MTLSNKCEVSEQCSCAEQVTAVWVDGLFMWHFFFFINLGFVTVSFYFYNAADSNLQLLESWNKLLYNKAL